MPTIQDSVIHVRERMAQAARRAGRDPDSIALVAVTKTVEPARIREAVAVGVRDLGESYYQEARGKLAQFGPEIRWHFIGHLQTNKAKYVVGRFDLIHSVDSAELAVELGRRAEAAGITQRVLVEVKLDPWATKYGVAPERVLELSERVAEIPGLCLCGLMGMAPFAENPELARSYFRRLRDLFERLPANHRQELSMGMTADFEVAIEEGATMVRIGSAIFGRRS